MPYAIIATRPKGRFPRWPPRVQIIIVGVFGDEAEAEQYNQRYFYDTRSDVRQVDVFASGQTEGPLMAVIPLNGSRPMLGLTHDQLETFCAELNGLAVEQLPTTDPLQVALEVTSDATISPDRHEAVIAERTGLGLYAVQRTLDHLRSTEPGFYPDDAKFALEIPLDWETPSGVFVDGVYGAVIGAFRNQDDARAHAAALGREGAWIRYAVHSSRLNRVPGEQLYATVPRRLQDPIALDESEGQAQADAEEAEGRYDWYMALQLPPLRPVDAISQIIQMADHWPTAVELALRIQQLTGASAAQAEQIANDYLA